jgi:nickel/cobalt transporter (NicO) family protein
MLINSKRHHDVLLIVALTITTACIVCSGIDMAYAQGAFGVGLAHVPHPADDGPFGWVLAKQAAYYRDFSGMIRATKSNGTAVYGLLGLSFTYGIFHAAGPGHGKAVISSYLIANGETWRRGIALSFASALLQALAAVAIVGIFAAILGGTAATMTQAARAIEIASYCLIVAVGLRLCWTKGRSFVAEMRGFKSAKRPLACTHDHDHRMSTVPANAAMRTVLSRSSSPGQAVGDAGSLPSWLSVCGRVPARFWFLSSRSLRDCSGSA